MNRWRSLNQSEKLAEKMEEEVLGKCKVQESKRGVPFKAEVTPWNGEKYARKTAGQDFSPYLENTTCSVCKASKKSTEQEEMKQQQRMAIMKDLKKKSRSKGRMDAPNLWWVSELLARDCEEAWIHTGWEDTLQKWYEWLEHLKKKDEKEKMEEMHQRKVKKLIKSAEGSAGHLHNITKPTMWRRGVQIFERDEEDVRFIDR